MLYPLLVLLIPRCSSHKLSSVDPENRFSSLIGAFTTNLMHSHCSTCNILVLYNPHHVNTAEGLATQVGHSESNSLIVSPHASEAKNSSEETRSKKYSSSRMVIAFVLDKGSRTATSVADALSSCKFINLRNDILLFVTQAKQPSPYHFRGKAFERIIKYSALVYQLSETSLGIQKLCPHCQRDTTHLVFTVDSMDINWKEFFVDIHRNFEQSLLRISLLKASGGVRIRRINGQVQPLKTGGFFLRTAITVAESLNSSYTLIPSVGYSWKRRNGTLDDGMLKDLVEDKADLGTAGAMVLETYGLVDMSHPIGFNYITFFLRTPRPVYSIYNLVRPFSLFSWIALAITISIATAVLTAIRRLWPVNNPEQWHLSRIGFDLLSTCVGQVNISPKTVPLRIFAGHWYLPLIVLSTAYTAKLVATFVRPPTERVPQTFGELGDSDYRVGFMNYGDGGHVVGRHLSGSKRPSGEKKIPGKWKPVKLFHCLENAAMDGKFACISLGENIATFLLMLEEKHGRFCMLDKSSEKRIPFYTVLLSRKGSLLLPTVDTIVARLTTSKLTRFWVQQTDRDLRQERWSKGEIKFKRAVTPPGKRALEYNEVWFTFQMTGGGLFCALFAFLCEYIWSSCHKRSA